MPQINRFDILVARKEGKIIPNQIQIETIGTVPPSGTVSPPNFSRKNFWGVILLGFVLPWIVRISVEAAFKPNEIGRILARFPELLFASGHNLFLLGLLNALPFVVFAFMTRWRYRMSAAEDPKTFLPHKLGVIFAGTTVLALTLFIQLVVWMNVFSPKAGSSTAVIAFVFLPFYALALMPVGYFVGWLIGGVLARRMK